MVVYTGYLIIFILYTNASKDTVFLHPLIEFTAHISPLVVSFLITHYLTFQWNIEEVEIGGRPSQVQHQSSTGSRIVNHPFGFRLIHHCGLLGNFGQSFDVCQNRIDVFDKATTVYIHHDGSFHLIFRQMAHPFPFFVQHHSDDTGSTQEKQADSHLYTNHHIAEHVPTASHHHHTDDAGAAQLPHRPKDDEHTYRKHYQIHLQ